MNILNAVFGKSEVTADGVKTEPLMVKPRVVNATHARYERLKEWLRENEVKIAETTLADDFNLSHHALAAYPAVKNGCLAYGAGCFADKKPNDPIYVLGDTHGDFDSFLAILDTILGMAKENGESSPIVYLLGDIVDRNEEGCMLECALIMAVLQKVLPEEFVELNSIRFAIVKGDHDIGLLYEDPYASDKRFRAMVSPADYCDWLNRRLDEGKGEDATKIGRAWIRLMKECPAAAFLEESGTLLSHGGVPREDLQKRVAAGEPYLLQSDAFAQDFEWCRMVDVKKKLLNRGSKTSEVGGHEFDSFCKTVFPCSVKKNGTATAVRRFVFAHQHPVKGFEQYSKWYDGYEVFCLASFRDDSVFGGPTIPHFARIQASFDVEEFDELADKKVTRHFDETVGIFNIELSFEEDRSQLDEGADVENVSTENINAESDAASVDTCAPEDVKSDVSAEVCSAPVLEAPKEDNVSNPSVEQSTQNVALEKNDSALEPDSGTELK